MRFQRFLGVFWIALCAAAPARADVERVEVLERTLVAEGRAFEAVGPYERLRGRLHFAVDAGAAENQTITDIRLAPRDSQGRVRFATDFVLVRPVDGARANGRLLFEADATEGPTLLATFNDAVADGGDTAPDANIGNGFLMEQGYSLLWLGWNWDVLPTNNRLRADLPVALDGTRAVFGRVLSEITVTEPVATARATGGAGLVGYEPARPDDPEAVLTVRETPSGPRTLIPRERWRFGRPVGERTIYDPAFVTLDDDFTPGAVYAVSYIARGPRIAGLGLAAVRDALLFYRTARNDRYGNPNPLLANGGDLPRAVLAYGSGAGARALQTMLYAGLTADSRGRLAFDGALINAAGAAKGPFNTRFGQGTRETGPDVGLDYPNIWYPFATVPQPDPVTGEARGLLDRLTDATPRLFYVNTSTDYWAGAASLTHTAIGATADLPPHEQARIYSIAGAPRRISTAGNRRDLAHCVNPLDYRPVLRSLLLHLDAWTTLDTAPPASELPLLSDASLGRVGAYLDQYPKIPGGRLPARAFDPLRTDFGGRFISEGIVDLMPPRTGRPFGMMVPLVDGDGLETAGIRLPEIEVPLGTYVGWNPQNASTGAPDRLNRIHGSFIPFPRSENERLATSDPRNAIAERYADRAAYTRAYAAAALALAEQGLILASDINPMIERASAFYDRIMARDPADESCAYLAP